VSPAAQLVERLRARGVDLLTDGERLGVRPAGVLTEAEREALRQHKAEVLALLRSSPPPATAPADVGRWSLPALNPAVVAEVLGPRPDPHHLAMLKMDVYAALRELEAGIAAGVLPPRRLAHGRPLADWLPLDDVAALFRAWGERARRTP
jgi:hypothetical protein